MRSLHIPDDRAGQQVSLLGPRMGQERVRRPTARVRLL